MLGAFAIPTFDNSDEDAKIDGRVRNYGLGIFSRLNLPRDFYIDLIAKAGRSQTKFDAKDIDYKVSMPYYNASFGVGKKIKFDSFMLDGGLNYALSYVGSDEADIGQSTLKFSSVTSSRAKIYSKIAVIQEDEEISLTQKGTSSEVEVGLRYTPTYATLINFGIAQSFGKKDQSSAKLQFAYRF